MSTRTNITKRRMRQKNRDGKVFEYDRYLLHYKDPATGKRRQRRFDTRKEAEAARNDLIKNAERMARCKGKKPPTLKEAVEYWLKSKKGVVAEQTHRAYTQISRDYIIGPAFDGTLEERRRYGMTGKLPPKAKLIPMLGADTKIENITTAEIRMWFLKVMEVSTPYVAKCAKRDLSSIFRLIEEDFEVRLARMPSRPGPAYRRSERKLLNEDQVRQVIEAALADPKWGVYYAFPFLTGTRPSEMLGLLWEDVDLKRGRIRICRTQKPDGELKAFTKTSAGMREVPINEILREMLIAWQERCPRLDGELHRVFPGQGFETKNGEPVKAGRPLSLYNYRMRVWYPMLDKLELPHISIYAARHMAISFLQARGMEVGLVAKIAGHANPQVTLRYYTHAVREHDGLMDELTAAYGLEKPETDKQSGVQL
ncbi:MAG: tyrosine-type recombinase/integrase [Alphaproteobacteria bacterium]|nr:tyrosine-type recombinase/integrase [Alphaproteobacteria bacterium]